MSNTSLLSKNESIQMNTLHHSEPNAYSEVVSRMVEDDCRWQEPVTGIHLEMAGAASESQRHNYKAPYKLKLLCTFYCASAIRQNIIVVYHLTFLISCS